MIRFCRFLICVSVLCRSSICSAEQLPQLVVYRESRSLSVRSKSGTAIFSIPVGIGRGGLGQKTQMSDLVTPTGEFVVDVILAPQSDTFEIAPALIKKYSAAKDFKELVSDRLGLQKLFNNMNSIDFDRNGSADKAYGQAYIGLHSAVAVTGPKMRLFGTTPYWYSIALHGTPDEASDIGAANSGGCVHLRAADLKRLVDEGFIAIGSRIIITD